MDDPIAEWPGPVTGWRNSSAGEGRGQSHEIL